MATIAQIERMLAELERIHPVAFFRRMDETQAGIGAVLIRKMAAKGLITNFSRSPRK